MDILTKPQIIALEQKLQQAILTSDVEILDELISDDLIFTNHLGQLMTKQDDLAAHKSGLLKINSIEPSEQKIQIVSEVAVISVRVKLSGLYDGKIFDGNLRFTRVWGLSGSDAIQITQHTLRAFLNNYLYFVSVPIFCSTIRLFINSENSEDDNKAMTAVSH